jgi:Asp-tRNA(Asn)/Glu-tRNA(Gln) amidotransferase B subunit
MRLKSDAIDYRYFREPNIVELNIDNLIKEAQASILTLPKTIGTELTKHNVSPNIIEQILDNYDAYKIFEKINSVIKNHALVAT